ncbi:hypothetical protein EVAR_79378_1 [Eumeta japonica]|uniref:THAP-type domain-containing protein n=1 Tax=Eumeta variegata TaxID=151549 RepID=A0A4C1TES9_EUMVA|nr:hypothetical protein EVAR_79378_1 [Eumeta japonica]
MIENRARIGTEREMSIGTKCFWFLRILLDPDRERYQNERIGIENGCKQWLKVVGNEELVYLPIEKLNKIRFVCGNHFSKEDFNKKGNRLKKHAVPIINLSRPPLTDVQLLDFPQHLFSRNVSIQEEIPSTSQERQPTLSESYTTVFVQEEMPGTIQERYPIPIKAYATVSIQEEMPGTSEERQPTLSESYTTVFAQEEMAGTSPERQPIPSESYATEYLKSISSSRSIQDRLCALVFDDEMSISSHLTYDMPSDKIEGYEDYGLDAEKIRRKRVGVGALLTEPLNLNGSKHYSAALQAYGQFY